MINYRVGDATLPGELPAIIAHVCNDEFRWGRGFVLSLSARFPEPERAYRTTRPRPKLGETQFVSISGGTIVVANMIAQHGVGPKNDVPPIRYPALENCLATVARKAKELNASVHMPRIGCGLAGGSWKVVGKLIEEQLKDVDVFVYDLPPQKLVKLP